ncbi:MAG: hypothetical protein AB8H86_12090 [Polyangiales bacterium]
MLPLSGCHGAALASAVLGARTPGSSRARSASSPSPEEVDVFAVEEDDEVDVAALSSVGLAAGVQNIDSTPALTGTLDYSADLRAFRVGLYGLFAGGTTNMEVRLGVRLSMVTRIDRWALEIGGEFFGLVRVRGVTGAGGGLGLRVGLEYRLTDDLNLALATSIAAIEYRSVDLGAQSDFIGSGSLGLRLFFGDAEHTPL